MANLNGLTGRARLLALMETASQEPANREAKAADQELQERGIVTRRGTTFTTPEFRKRTQNNAAAQEAMDLVRFMGDYGSSRRAAEAEPTKRRSSLQMSSIQEPGPHTLTQDAQAEFMTRRAEELQKAGKRFVAPTAREQYMMQQANAQARQEETRSTEELFDEAARARRRATGAERMRDDAAASLRQNPGRMFDRSYIRDLERLRGDAESARRLADQATLHYQEVATQRQNEEEREKYLSLMENPDFAALSQPRQEWLDQRDSFAVQKKGLNRYYQINHREEQEPTSNLRYMNDTEAAIYNYVAAKQGLDAAEAYYKGTVEPKLNGRRNTVLAGKYREQADRMGPVAGALSVPASLLSGVGMLDVTGQNIARALGITPKTKPVDYARLSQLPGLYADTVREERVENITDGYLEKCPDADREKAKNWIGFLYNTGMSMADSYSAVLLNRIGVPEPATLALLAGSAGTRAIKDAKARGATDGEALGFGISSAIAEAFFEKISLDKLLDETSTAAAWAIRHGKEDLLESWWGRQLLHTMDHAVMSSVEGSEEFLTAWANTAADQWILGDKSEIFTRQRELMEQGVSEKEALKASGKQWLTGILGDALGGVISGGGMSALNGARNRIARFDPLEYTRQQMREAGTAGAGLPHATVPKADPAAAEGAGIAAAVPLPQKAAEAGESAPAISPLVLAERKLRSGTALNGQDARAILADEAAVRTLTEAGLLPENTRNDSTGRQTVLRAAEQYAQRKNGQTEAPAREAKGLQLPRIPKSGAKAASGAADAATKAQGERENVQAAPKAGEAQRGAERASGQGNRTMAPPELPRIPKTGQTGEKTEKSGAKPLTLPTVEKSETITKPGLELPRIPGKEGSGPRTDSRKTRTRQAELARQRQRQMEDGRAESLRSRGFDNAGEQETVYIRTEDRWDADERAVAAALRAQGIEPTFVTGLLRDAAGNRVSSLRNGDRLALQADSRRETLQDLAENALGKSLGIGGESFAEAAGQAAQKRSETPPKPERIESARAQAARSSAEAQGMSAEDADTMARLAEVLGKDIRAYSKAEKNGSWENGYTQGGKIYVNAAVQRRPVVWVVAHELTHNVENARAYNGLRNLAKQAYGDRWTQMVRDRAASSQRVARDLADTSVALDQAEAEREVTADFFASRLLTDEQAIRDVAAHDATTGRRIVAYLKNLLNKLQGKEPTLEWAIDRYSAALKEAAEEARRSGEGRGRQYSIGDLKGQQKDYGKGVILDTNLFKGVSPRNWGRVLGPYVYKNMAGAKMTMYDSNGNAETVELARENDRVKKDGSKNSRKVLDELARTNGDNIKALATVHLSELLAVSGNETSTDDHSHQWMDEHGWTHRTAYIQDRNGKIYEATLNIANGRDRRILYAISNVREIDRSTTGGAVPSAVSGGARSTSRGTSGKKIPQKQGKSKRQHSAESEGEVRYSAEDATEAVEEYTLDDENRGESVFRSGWLNRNRQMAEEIVRNRAQIETKAFKDWFGNSQALNLQGDPLLVFHGAGAHFTTFDTGGKPIWFSPNPMYAVEYSSIQRRAEKLLPGSAIYGGSEDRMIPAYIRAENPADFGDTDGYFEPNVQRLARETGISPRELRDVWQRTGKRERIWETVNTAEMVKMLQAHGFDSIKAVENGGSTWAVFESGQAKSAVANNGRFDRGRGDLRYSAENTEDTEDIALGGRRILDTPALKKMGVKISAGVGRYANTEQLLAKDKAARELKRAAREAEKRLSATEAEMEFASGIAAMVYDEEDIPGRLNKDTVMELADYYWAADSANLDTLHKLRADINQGLRDEARSLMKDADFRPMSMLLLNERTPERSFRSMFGSRGDEVVRWLIDPVRANEAEKIRWYNRQMDAVREFKDGSGKTRELTREESALTMKVMEGKAAAMTLANMEADPKNRHGKQIAQNIRNAAENIRNGEDPGDTTREFSLDERARELAEQYAGWLNTQEELKKADHVIVEAAAAKYSEIFDDFYAAINDFLVAHGYEPIGYIKGYAPHMQPEENHSGLEKAFKALGINTEVTELPVSIAGRTANFKPNKRWNPYFLQRTGDAAEYDIVKAYQSYVDYLADILYHTDDVMRVRQTSNWIRQNYGPEEIRHMLDWAQELRRAPTELKQRLLRDAGEIGSTTVLSPVDTEIRMQAYTDKLFEQIGDTAQYSHLVMWLDNYANILAGKQSFADRGWEYSTGRKSLNLANRLNNAFQKANVAGNLSSVLNQTAQLPMIAAELGPRDFNRALLDVVTGRVRQGSFLQDSDFLAAKTGKELLYTDNADKFISALFAPAGAADQLVSTLAVRGAFNKAIRSGASYAEAMARADAFGQAVMGSRAKGSRPLAYESKGFISKMVHMFQVEAVNSWDHILTDVPREIRRIAVSAGKKKAAEALAALVLRALMGTFLLNRLTETLYGGTPAPFDVLGLTANFVASGKGLSTNRYLATITDNVLEKLGAERILGTEPMSARDFELESAAEDLAYNVMNDLPLLRNAAGVLGLGDQTVPLPGASGEFADVAKAAGAMLREGVAPGEVENLLRAMLKAATQFVPGGRQISKTVQGAEAAIRGGSYSGYGEKERLQYPVRGAADIGRALLFGKSATAEADAFWASGRSSLSARQTGLYKALAASGLDRKTAYEAIQRYREIDNDKSLSSFERGRAERDLIDGLNTSDENKLEMYRTLGNADSRAEKFETLMEAGLSFGDCMDIYDKYAEIDTDEESRAGDKAGQFALWVDRQGYSDEQAAKVKDQFKYWQIIPASADRYERIAAAGLDSETAYSLNQALSALEPEDGSSGVSDLQKWQAVLRTVSGEEAQARALSAVMSEGQFEKFQAAEAAGIGAGVYVEYKAGTKDISADKDAAGNPISGSKKAKVVAYIDSLDLTPAQKGVLLSDYNSSYSQEGITWHNGSYRSGGGGGGSGAQYAPARHRALRLPSVKDTAEQSGRNSGGLQLPRIPERKQTSGGLQLPRIPRSGKSGGGLQLPRIQR